MLSPPSHTPCLGTKHPLSHKKVRRACWLADLLAAQVFVREIFFDCFVAAPTRSVVAAAHHLVTAAQTMPQISQRCDCGSPSVTCVQSAFGSMQHVTQLTQNLSGLASTKLWVCNTTTHLHSAGPSVTLHTPLKSVNAL